MAYISAQAGRLYRDAKYQPISYHLWLGGKWVENIVKNSIETVELHNIPRPTQLTKNQRSFFVRNIQEILHVFTPADAGLRMNAVELS